MSSPGAHQKQVHCCSQNNCMHSPAVYLQPRHCYATTPTLCILLSQVIAYNKMDTPASSDYWQDIRESLVAEGVPQENIVAISAVAGSGVLELVRRTRAVLEALPTDVAAAPLTNAVNVAEVSRGRPGWRNFLQMCC